MFRLFAFTLPINYNTTMAHKKSNLKPFQEVVARFVINPTEGTTDIQFDKCVETTHTAEIKAYIMAAFHFCGALGGVEPAYNFMRAGLQTVREMATPSPAVVDPLGLPFVLSPEPPIDNIGKELNSVSDGISENEPDQTAQNAKQSDLPNTTHTIS